MSRPGSGRRCCPLDRDRGSSSITPNGVLIIEASVGCPPTVLTAGGTCPIEGDKRLLVGSAMIEILGIADPTRSSVTGHLASPASLSNPTCQNPISRTFICG